MGLSDAHGTSVCSNGLYAADFIMEDGAFSTPEATIVGLHSIDHVALGLEPAESLELADPFGLASRAHE